MPINPAPPVPSNPPASTIANSRRLDRIESGRDESKIRTTRRASIDRRATTPTPAATNESEARSAMSASCRA